MKVLVLTGPESSGKSWLGGEIQAAFGGLMVGEYVRHFIDTEQRDTCYADVATIARGQLVWEDAARAAQPQLLILDTHLLSNLLWSRLLFGAAPPWLESRNCTSGRIFTGNAVTGWSSTSSATARWAVTGRNAATPPSKQYEPCWPADPLA